MIIKAAKKGSAVRWNFYKCQLCGRVFHHGNKSGYCTHCVPKVNGWSYGYSVVRNYGEVVADRSSND